MTSQQIISIILVALLGNAQYQISTYHGVFSTPSLTFAAVAAVLTGLVVLALEVFDAPQA